MAGDRPTVPHMGTTEGICIDNICVRAAQSYRELHNRAAELFHALGDHDFPGFN